MKSLREGDKKEAVRGQGLSLSGATRAGFSTTGGSSKELQAREQRAKGKVTRSVQDLGTASKLCRKHREGVGLEITLDVFILLMVTLPCK